VHGWKEQCFQLKFFQDSAIVRNELSYKAHIWAAEEEEEEESAMI